jgi:hypothetical protein
VSLEYAVTIKGLLAALVHGPRLLAIIRVCSSHCMCYQWFNYLYTKRSRHNMTPDIPPELPSKAANYSTALPTRENWDQTAPFLDPIVDSICPPCNLTSSTAMEEDNITLGMSVFRWLERAWKSCEHCEMKNVKVRREKNHPYFIIHFILKKNYFSVKANLLADVAGVRA